MSKNKNFFSEEIELSEIVLKKTNQAFEMIQKEDIDYMKRADMESRRLFKTRAAAVACVCIVAVSSVTAAAAAIHHYWGRGMNGNIQASDDQQQTLTEKNVAKVYEEDPDDSSLSVTDSGITIAPNTVVVDERFAYMSFKISGYSLEDKAEPGFERVNVYQEDQSADDASHINTSGTMYDGIIPDENGQPVYEDGTPLENYEDGSTICHYTDSNGDLEYIIQAYVSDVNGSMLGKTIHVDFKNLGTFAKAEFTPAVEGKWDLEITLPDASSAQTIEVGKKVAGTEFTLDNIDISPISMKVNYSVGEAPAEDDDNFCVPQVEGVVLKDGTRIPYLADGGMSGYVDSSKSKAYHMTGYDRVIDVDEVAALIVLPSFGSDRVEIAISE
ncbi:MAG: DUF4179 domain-containing protein [Eubacterium sp.]|nr:DUF4179 domain-containing protein [Eubacterium sp.]